MNARLTGLSYVLPALAVMALVLFLPVVYGGWFSTFRIQYGAPTSFIGFGNYVRLFADPALAATLRRTILFATSSVILTVVISMALATWVNRLRGRKAFVVQMVIILPWVISAVVATLLFRWVFINDIGLSMSLLHALGLPAWHPLTDGNVAMAFLIAVSVWKRIGYALIVLLAGLKGIPDDYYEAARIDGAADHQIFRMITLPLMKTPLLLVTIVLTLSNLNTVESPLVLTGGGPGDATRILPIDVFTRAFVNYDLGSGTALALAIFAANVLLVAAYLRIARWQI